MTYILDSDIVWVVIQLHAGVIFNTAVFAEYDEANNYYWGIKNFELGDDDSVDIQECKIIQENMG